MSQKSSSQISTNHKHPFLYLAGGGNQPPAVNPNENNEDAPSTTSLSCFWDSLEDDFLLPLILPLRKYNSQNNSSPSIDMGQHNSQGDTSATLSGNDSDNHCHAGNQCHCNGDRTCSYKRPLCHSESRTPSCHGHRTQRKRTFEEAEAIEKCPSKKASPSSQVNCCSREISSQSTRSCTSASRSCNVHKPKGIYDCYDSSLELKHPSNKTSDSTVVCCHRKNLNPIMEGFPSERKHCCYLYKTRRTPNHDNTSEECHGSNCGICHWGCDRCSEKSNHASRL